MAIKKLPSTGDAPRSTGVPESLLAGGTADSAGIPWQGRTFAHHDTAFANDSGAAPEPLVQALRAFHEESLHLSEANSEQPLSRVQTDRLGRCAQHVMAALAKHRVLVPMLAEAGQVGETPDGRTVDKTQELSIVTLATPDRRRALPVFTSTDTMRAWNPEARPIPVAGPQAALAAVQEETDVLIMDPGNDVTEFAVRRPAVQALATGEVWVPAWRDEAVTAEISHTALAEPAVSRAAVSLGDPAMRLHAAELDVWIGIADPLAAPELREVVGRLQATLASLQIVTDRVDSLRLKPVAV